MSTTGDDATGQAPNSCLEKANACLTLQHAINIADSGDTISVESGKYMEVDQAHKPMSIVGEGSGATIEADTADDPTFVISSNVTLRNLQIVGGDGAVVIETFVNSPTVEIVSSTLSVTAASSDALYVDSAADAIVTKSTITAGPSARAAIVENGGTVAVEDSSVEGPQGIVAQGGHVGLTRDSIQASKAGIVQLESSTVTLRDSLIAPRPGGILTFGAGVVDSGGSLTVVGSTVFATDTGTTMEHDPIALAAQTGSGTTEITVSNSILMARATVTPDGASDISNLGSGTITWLVTHSSFTTSSGSGVPVAGAGSNLAAAPVFADQVAGDYHLVEAPSALIDSGDPGQVEAGETDLGGGPRAIDGNCDKIAQPDIGAYELVRTAPCPPPAANGDGSSSGSAKLRRPAITRISVKRSGGREILRFTLSEPATVKISIERVHTHVVHGKRKTTYTSAGTIRFDAKRSGAQRVPLHVHAGKVKTGRYRLTLVATNSAGKRSLRHRKTFGVSGG